MQWNPEDYAKNSDAQLKWAQELRQTLALQGHESILDIGCGDGKITADFAATFPQAQVVGIDSSPEMIAYAAQTYPASQYPNLAFACQDACSLNFESAFDLCFSNATLHWVADHPALLQGVSRALRPGGRLIISCGGQGNAQAILAIFAELATRPAWQPYFQGFENPYFFYGISDYADWLTTTGFKIERLELVPKDMTHLGAAGLAGWIRTTWMPFTQKVPANKQDQLITDFVTTYLAKLPLDAQGLAHVQMVRLEVNALKI
jgi:trans-aconitate 2-methyltransferase